MGRRGQKTAEPETQIEAGSQGPGRVREPFGARHVESLGQRQQRSRRPFGRLQGMEASSPEAKILDDATEFEELRNTVNYKSVAEQREDAAIEIERYIKKGYAVRKTWDWVQKEFGSGTCSRANLTDPPREGWSLT